MALSITGERDSIAPWHGFHFLSPSSGRPVVWCRDQDSSGVHTQHPGRLSLMDWDHASLPHANPGRGASQGRGGSRTPRGRGPNINYAIQMNTFAFSFAYTWRQKKSIVVFFFMKETNYRHLPFLKRGKSFICLHKK